jgi:hypothetical protein
LVLLLEYPGKNGRVVQRAGGRGEAGLDRLLCLAEAMGLARLLGEESMAGRGQGLFSIMTSFTDRYQDILYR